jgi:hypothetical protein
VKQLKFEKKFIGLLSSAEFLFFLLVHRNYPDKIAIPARISNAYWIPNDISALGRVFAGRGGNLFRRNYWKARPQIA